MKLTPRASHSLTAGRYQFYLQVKQDVLQGRVPCAPHTAAELAALTLQAELGDYEPGNQDPGYASVYRFTPNQNEELEQKAEAQHRWLRDLTPGEAEQRFLGIAQTLDMYGVDMHAVFGEDRINYFLGLTPSGVLVFREKVRVGQYLWPQIMRINFKGSHFELRVRSKDNGKTSYYFEASNRTACKKLWKCCVDSHAFFRGRTMLQVERDTTCHLPRPCQVVRRRRSKTYPRRMAHAVVIPKAVSTSIAHVNGDGLIVVQPPYVVRRQGSWPYNGSEVALNSKNKAPWDKDAAMSGLFGSRGQSPKFPRQQSRPPSGSGVEPCRQDRRRRSFGSRSGDSEPGRRRKRRSRSRGSQTSESANESEVSCKEHQCRGRSQVNHMVDSAPQWEAVLQQQQERNQADPAYRHSRQRSRSRSPDKQARHKLWKNIEWELVDPIGFTDEQLKEIPYTLVETKGDPVKLCHSHSPNAHRHRRRSASSDGARSALTDLYNSQCHLVEPLAVTIGPQPSSWSPPMNSGTAAQVAAPEERGNTH
uniref:band 4.1-like protein 4A isoform X2 n=1 Tax=Myxine glutinosa TaxID=7769 RepID=UPI00358F6D62